MERAHEHDWSAFACPNPHCSAFGPRGSDNLGPHGWSSKAHGIRCLRCTVCGKSFSERAGTPLFRSRLPEAKAVETEALDKLSLAPWSIREGWKTNSLSSTNATSLLLRTLADDLLQEESYLEIQQPSTNRGPELVVALKLSGSRAETWHTNLATALSSLTGVAITSNTPTPGGWPWR